MKLKANIIKEILLLLSDKIGLFFMFFMPIFLVFIITIIQNSAYEIINENKISLLVSNQDKGELGDSLINLLEESRMFDISLNNSIELDDINKFIIDNNIIVSVYISSNFTDYLNTKATKSTDLMLYKMGIADSLNPIKVPKTSLEFIYDPVLQENYVKSIESLLFQMISVLENTIFIENIFFEIGVENNESKELKEKLFQDKISINTRHAILSNKTSKKPNATQHNIPAWTIFAMFFMVVSLANNIVKEKNNGSFVRIKTMPTSILTVLLSKMLVYIFAAFLQVLIIFSIGVFIFPLLNLPQLELNSSLVLFFLVILFTSISAVSWAMFIGVYAKTQEQASGVGAISIIIFAALGGVWVPTFVMPSYLKFISKMSPMNWSLEGFYTLLLKDGNLNELLITFAYILIFVIVMQFLSISKLKKENLL